MEDEKQALSLRADDARVVESRLAVLLDRVHDVAELRVIERAYPTATETPTSLAVITEPRVRPTRGANSIVGPA